MSTGSPDEHGDAEEASRARRPTHRRQQRPPHLVHAVKEEQLSNAVAGVVGELVSDKWETKARRGRARLDDTQNAINKTLVAPYSVRAGPGAPVSIPITWDELDDPDLRSDRWDVRSAPARVAEQGDPMARVLTDAQRLPPLE
ncbi:MAG TPA: hypothetical protein VFW97_04545 [Acidimicrobiia bacterium]|nr:hypothetical protein [Acidimicrobiia bacterium]